MNTDIQTPDTVIPYLPDKTDNAVYARFIGWHDIYNDILGSNN